MDRNKRLAGIFPRLFWSSTNGINYPTFRDEAGAIVEPFTSYLDQLILSAENVALPQKARNSKLEAATYALLELARFLNRHQLPLRRFNDSVFAALNKAMLQSVEKNPVSRGHPAQAKRTVNVKIKQVYHFLQWGQANHRLPQGTIGWGSNNRVRSSLPESVTRASRSDFSSERLYPLLIKGAGSSGRTDRTQHWATDTEIEALEEHFWRSCSYLIAVRNILIVRIEQLTAFRNESANSLLVEQFSDKATEDRSEEVYRLIPRKQKRGAGLQLSMDWALVDRIREFIRDDRPALLQATGATEAHTQGRIFFSSHRGAHSGKPLTDRAFGEILSDGFRAIGAPKGAGGHSLRRYRAVLQCKLVIARIRAENRPMTRDEVVREVMDLLGHTAEESGRAYDKAMVGYKFWSTDSEFLRRALKAELELDRIRAAVARLLNSVAPEILQSVHLENCLKVLKGGADQASLSEQATSVASSNVSSSL